MRRLPVVRRCRHEVHDQELLTLHDRGTLSCLLSPPCILDPLRAGFLARLPRREVVHPLGCHRRRIQDSVVFDTLVAALVTECDHERLADSTCSATMLRRRRDEWSALGLFEEQRLFEEVRLAALDACEAMIGLDLGDVCVDGCITKAPCGGECAGPSPVDRGKQGLKRSQLTDGAGVPLATVSAPANSRDHVLLPATLDTLKDFGAPARRR